LPETVSPTFDQLRIHFMDGPMRSFLGWMTISWFVLVPASSLAQATSDWNAVTNLTPASLVRVTGARAGVRQRLTGNLHSANDSGIALTQVARGATSFDRANVQRVELVIVDAKARERTIVKGLGVGAAFTAIFTGLGLAGGWQESSAAQIAAMYAVTLGGGAGIGVLKSIGKGSTYVRVYERP
jgi:hypothetical protein